MSAIKLPVRVEGRSIYDAADAVLDVWDLVTALNAAPTRAFKELTVEALGEMLSEAGEEAGDPLGDQFARTSWLVAHDTALLSRLQAFAAPQAPQWMPITVEAVNGKGYFLLRPSKTNAACECPTVAQLIPSERVSGEFEWEDESGCNYSFGCFDYYLPLDALPGAPERPEATKPAWEKPTIREIGAPEAQGGDNG